MTSKDDVDGRARNSKSTDLDVWLLIRHILRVSSDANASCS
jgi:hypothetical protein